MAGKKTSRKSPSISRRKKDAIKWWTNKLKLEFGNKITANTILRKRRDKFRIIPGYVVLFAYKAKHAKTLPYWDRFPLAVILEVDKDRWLALNLHYVPVSYRVKAFRRIEKLVKGDKTKKTTRAAITYAVFKSMSSISFLRGAVKTHLYNHMVKKPVRITYEELQYAVYLDLEQWMVGMSKANIASFVHKQTLKASRK